MNTRLINTCLAWVLAFPQPWFVWHYLDDSWVTFDRDGAVQNSNEMVACEWVVGNQIGVYSFGYSYVLWVYVHHIDGRALGGPFHKFYENFLNKMFDLYDLYIYQFTNLFIYIVHRAVMYCRPVSIGVITKSTLLDILYCFYKDILYLLWWIDLYQNKFIIFINISYFIFLFF